MAPALADCVSSFLSAVSSDSVDRRSLVGEDAKNLIQSGDGKNGFHAFLQAEDRKLSAVGLRALQRLDQDRQSGTVDVGDPGQIEEDALRFSRNERCETYYYQNLT